MDVVVMFIVAGVTVFFHNLAVAVGIGVIILTGSGEKAFVAGADIKEFADFSKL